jgi:hypothetical protein
VDREDTWFHTKLWYYGSSSAKGRCDLWGRYSQHHGAIFGGIGDNDDTRNPGPVPTPIRHTSHQTTTARGMSQARALATFLIKSQEFLKSPKRHTTYGIKHSNPFWVCEKRLETGFVTDSERSPRSNDSVRRYCSEVHHLSAHILSQNQPKQDEDFRRTLQDAMKREILSVADWTLRLQVHSEIAIRFYLLYGRLPTVEESISITGFSSHRIRTTRGYEQDMDPSGSNSFLRHISVLARAWELGPGRSETEGEAEE